MYSFRDAIAHQTADIDLVSIAQLPISDTNLLLSYAEIVKGYTTARIAERLRYDL